MIVEVAMPFESGALADSSYTLAQAGTLIGKAAEMKRSSSAMGRAGSAITALMIGTRFVPGASRLLKRSPFLGSFLIAGTIGALILVYSRRVRA
jgi:hypothetical protein